MRKTQFVGLTTYITYIAYDLLVHIFLSLLPCILPNNGDVFIDFIISACVRNTVIAKVQRRYIIPIKVVKFIMSVQLLP